MFKKKQIEQETAKKVVSGTRAKITKDYYEVQELVQQPWFVPKSTITLRKLIDKGRIKAVDISTNPKFKRYVVYKHEIIKYLNL